MACKTSGLLFFFIGACCVYQSHAFKAVETQASLQDGETQTAWLTVDASEETGRIIPETLFGIFYEVP